MYKHKIKLVLFLVTVLFLVGCSKENTTTDTDIESYLSEIDSEIKETNSDKLVNFFIENGYSGFIGDLADTTAYFLEHYADCSDILEIESTSNLDTILVTDINNTVFKVVLNIEANRVENVSVVE